MHNSSSVCQPVRTILGVLCSPVLGKGGEGRGGEGRGEEGGRGGRGGGEGRGVEARQGERRGGEGRERGVVSKT